jgi:electron transport complex protein RnfB
MPGNVYEQLANALDRLPNGYPRTSSGVELRILQKIFSDEEAALAGCLTGKYETLNEITARAPHTSDDLGRQLFKMAQRGLVWVDRQDGRALFRLAPFVVGIYEAQLESLDHELSHLVEDYFREGGTRGIMSAQPALHRVVPAQKALKSEWILPYDDIRSIILESKTFNVRDCICRVQKAQIGEPCHFPVHTCLNFSPAERPARPGDISRTEALETMDQIEEIGLVHSVSNVAQGVFYVCNCCGCCCGILRGITEFGIENSVAHANYFAYIEPEACTGCGICIERCQVKAITDQNGTSVVDRQRCIGCGLCVTGCPGGAARLERKSEAETIHPPLVFTDWETQRLKYRGLG